MGHASVEVVPCRDWGRQPGHPGAMPHMRHRGAMPHMRHPGAMPHMHAMHTHAWRGGLAHTGLRGFMHKLRPLSVPLNCFCREMSVVRFSSKMRIPSYRFTHDTAAFNTARTPWALLRRRPRPWPRPQRACAPLRAVASRCCRGCPALAHPRQCP
eukprot:363611-Chlamydomonas_euryale.AAC.19